MSKYLWGWSLFDGRRTITVNQPCCKYQAIFLADLAKVVLSTSSIFYTIRIILVPYQQTNMFVLETQASPSFNDMNSAYVLATDTRRSVFGVITFWQLKACLKPFGFNACEPCAVFSTGLTFKFAVCSIWYIGILSTQRMKRITDTRDTSYDYCKGCSKRNQNLSCLVSSRFFEVYWKLFRLDWAVKILVIICSYCFWYVPDYLP